MSRAVANVVIATDTFAQLVDKVNVIADIITSGTITVSANSSGDQASGNSVVNGTMVITTIVAGADIRGGNLTSSGVLTVSSAANVANTFGAGNTTISGFITVANTMNVNGVATFKKSVIANGSVTIANTLSTGNTTINGWVGVNDILSIKTSELASNTATVLSGATLIDSVPLVDASTYKYIVNVSQPSRTPVGKHAIEMLIIHDNVDVYVTKYADINNVDLGVFTSNINGANLEVKFTPTSANTYDVSTFRMQLG